MPGGAGETALMGDGPEITEVMVVQEGHECALIKANEHC
jgi:hypothetical protein